MVPNTVPCDSLWPIGVSLCVREREKERGGGRGTLFAVSNTVPCKSLWTIMNETKKIERNCLFAIPNTVPCDNLLARVRETDRDREKERASER